MSVLEATLFYTKSATKFTEERIHSHIFGYSEKRKIFYIFLFSVAVLSALNLYFSGSTATNILAYKELKNNLENLNAQTEMLKRQMIIGSETFSLNFFINHGYEEPKKIDTITRIKNVAGRQTNKLVY